MFGPIGHNKSALNTIPKTIAYLKGKLKAPATNEKTRQDHIIMLLSMLIVNYKLGNTEEYEPNEELVERLIKELSEDDLKKLAESADTTPYAEVLWAYLFRNIHNFMGPATGIASILKYKLNNEGLPINNKGSPINNEISPIIKGFYRMIITKEKLQRNYNSVKNSSVYNSNYSNKLKAYIRFLIKIHEYYEAETVLKAAIESLPQEYKQLSNPIFEFLTIMLIEMYKKQGKNQEGADLLEKYELVYRGIYANFKDPHNIPQRRIKEVLTMNNPSPIIKGEKPGLFGGRRRRPTQTQNLTKTKKASHKHLSVYKTRSRKRIRYY